MSPTARSSAQPHPRPRILAGVAAMLALVAVTAACAGPAGDPDGLGATATEPQPTTRTAAPDPSGAEPADPDPGATAGRPEVVRVVASGLQVPWGLAFLPSGDALVSERDTARILLVPAAGGSGAREVGRVAAAAPEGESGVLGLALSPSYAEDRLVYAYVTTAEDNRVVTMTYDGVRLGPAKPVFTGIPRGYIHDGGRLLFDDEGMLWVSTGETGDPPLSQDASSTAGKILRITPEGDPAPGNPVDGSPVWSMGHRNVQGLAFDDRGRLWATEFGQDTWDELNLIQRGRNYGWPLVEGRGDLEEYRNPVVVWPTEVASPSGLAWLAGSLWAGALRGRRLWEVPVTASGAGEPRGWFVGDFGRVRTVALSPAGTLWLTTSNRDGRGDPVEGDDRIVEVALR